MISVTVYKFVNMFTLVSEQYLSTYIIYVIFYVKIFYFNVRMIQMKLIGFL